MKKIFAIAFVAAAVMSAHAEDWTVYNNGQLGAGLNVYGWWAAGMNFQAEDPAGSDTKVYSFKADNAGAAASMGVFNDGQTLPTGKLNSATLNFKWYATGAGEAPAYTKYTIRLTADGGVEQNYSFEVTEENVGQWNSVALPVATIYPEVSAQWKDFVGKGAGYVFSVVMDNGTPESVIYFDNIYYSDLDESWEAPHVVEAIPPTTVPAIEQAQEDVLSVFSPYGNKAFNIGGWGQSTNYAVETIDGKEVAHLTNFNYLGWEFPDHFSIEGYKYMHVDFYTCEETTFGFTPISPGAEKGWVAPTVNVNEWNSYDAPISYFSNVVLNDIFQIKFDQGKKVDCYIANVYFYKIEGGDEPDPDQPGNGATYNGTITGTDSYEAEGQTKEFPFTLKYSITYNEDKTLSVKANFTWAQGEPAGMVPGGVFINNEGNDFTLTNGVRTVTTTATYTEGEKLNIRIYIPRAYGLVNVPEFDYIVGSESQGGDEPDPDPDPDQPGNGATYAKSITGIDSYEAEGETKEFPYTMNYSITYNEDKTLTVKCSFDWENGEPAGMVPGSVFINNVMTDFTLVAAARAIDGMRAGETVREATTTETYNEGESLNVRFHIPRAYGVVNIPEIPYSVGEQYPLAAIESVEVSTPSVPVYYDLRGVRVDHPANGIYIRVQDGTATKVRL